MEKTKGNAMVGWVCDVDLSVCRAFNRASRRGGIRQFFALVSRLGDGVFWYSLMAVLPLLYGGYGVQASLHMLLVGLVGLGVYKAIKGSFVRERPFVTHAEIRIGTAPLDRHSFPSGHTLHAVGFTLVATAYFPMIAWLLVPFALLIAASRMVLGLHYPSDVLMGAAIGQLLAWLSFMLLELPYVPGLV